MRIFSKKNVIMMRTAKENGEGNESDRTPVVINIGYLFGAIMLVVYFGMAYLLLLTDLFKEVFNPVLRYAFGFLFMIYGVFRAYRFIKYKGYR